MPFKCGQIREVSLPIFSAYVPFVLIFWHLPRTARLRALSKPSSQPETSNSINQYDEYVQCYCAPFLLRNLHFQFNGMPINNLLIKMSYYVNVFPIFQNAMNYPWAVGPHSRQRNEKKSLTTGRTRIHTYRA